MIKTTTTAVKYDIFSPELEAVVYKKVLKTERNDDREEYTIYTAEWLLDDDGREQYIRYSTPRVMSFAEIDDVVNYLEANYVITQIGSARRKRLTELGLLVVNNQEGVLSAIWEEF